MTMNDLHMCDRVGMLEALHAGLKNYRRDSLFTQSATLDRIWWAETFEAVESTYTRIKAVVLATTDSTEGCWETHTQTPARLVYRGRRIYAYQLVYWSKNTLLPSYGEVVRHKCHNRRCINPDHLAHGTQRDNIDDEITKLLSHPNLLV